MFGKMLNRFGIVALAATLLACATSQQTAPQKHEVSLGGGSTAQSGLFAGGTREGMVAGETAATGFAAKSGTFEGVKQHRAQGVVSTLKCVNPPTCTKHKLAKTETVWNVKTTAGIDFLFAQGYGSSGAQANGLVYIGLSNDALTETTASTTLSNEITGNGLAASTVSRAAVAQPVDWAIIPSIAVS